MSEHIEPFRIAATDEQLGDLKQRLRNTPLARAGMCGRLDPGYPAQLHPGAVQILARAIRLAGARGAAQSLSAIPDHNRRTGEFISFTLARRILRRCRW